MPDCGKISFGSKRAASLSRANRRNKGARMRAYFCRDCLAYHLSSRTDLKTY